MESTVADVRCKNLESDRERDLERDPTVPFYRKLCEYLRRDFAKRDSW
jgi:hypothetical protein